MGTRKKPEVELKKSEIISRYMFGDTVIQLSKEYGLSRERIYQYLRDVKDWDEEKGIYKDRKRHQRKIQDQKLRPLIINDRRQGVKLCEVAKKHHTSTRRIKRILQGTGYEGGKPYLEKRDRKILRMYKRGFTQREVGEKFNTCQNNVSRILRKFKENGQL